MNASEKPVYWMVAFSGLMLVLLSMLTLFPVRVDAPDWWVNAGVPSVFGGFMLCLFSYFGLKRTALTSRASVVLLVALLCVSFLAMRVSPLVGLTIVPLTIAILLLCIKKIKKSSIRCADCDG